MTRLTMIHDAEDPRLAPYRSVRERDLVGRQGRFIVEGEVVLRQMVRRGRFGLESLFISEKRIEALGPLLDDLPADLPVYCTRQGVMETIVGFPLHRGVLGIGLRGEEPGGESLLARMPGCAMVVACMGIANHDNMGGIFRNAAAFGVHGVLIDDECCDPLYRKAIRVSVGATLTLPFARIRGRQRMLPALAQEGFETIALSPRGAETLEQIAATAHGRIALLLGTEGPGLPEAVMARLRSARIPMADDFDSLNVATTSGIALYALTRRRGEESG